MENVEALRAFFSRVTPVLPELFGMAHTICGNYDLAEYALQYALMDVWLSEHHGGVGFRDLLKNTLCRVAMDEAIEPRAEMPEFTWDGLRGGVDGLAGMIASQSSETRRLLALHYGCGLSDASAARLTGLSTKQVRERLGQFVRRASAELPREEKQRFEARLERLIIQQLARSGGSMPPVNAIYRSFAQEASEARRPRYLASKLGRAVLYGVLIFLCALVFWLTAVLIHPAELETSDAQMTDTVFEGETAIPSMQVFPAISSKI